MRKFSMHSIRSCDKSDIETGANKNPPVIWIVFLPVHYYGFKNVAFTHHKLYHPVDEEQQVPVGTEEYIRTAYVPETQCTLISLLFTA